MDFEIAEQTDAAHLSPSTDWLHVVQETAGVGVWDWRVEQPAASCTESNPVLYGLPPRRFMPSYSEWLNLIYPEDRHRVSHELEMAMSGSTKYETEFRVVWPDGTIRWLAGKGRAFRDHCGKPNRLIGVNYDITRLKEIEFINHQAARQLTHQAMHDMLTGLPNRRMIEQEIRQSVARAAAAGGRMALLYIDLDGFKFINDSLGHKVGDELLIRVSDRLSRCVRQPDIVGRTGGDEFTVIIRAAIDGNEVEIIANRLLTSLQEPFHVSRHELFVSASVGISLFPEHGSEEGVLQQNADLAMYRAKRSGKNNCQFFTAEMAEPARERLELDGQLRRALGRDELSLHFQPIRSLEGQAMVVVGYEALLRWQHPRLGMISPARFIPVAEETGLILQIGSWVLDEACLQIRHWRGGGLTGMKLHINISGLQFVRPDFVTTVRGALQRHGVPGDCLGIELTESILMRDFESSSRKIGELKDLGVTTSIDDFGTGYSSLGYLQCLPIDALKIDGSFVREIGKKPNATALVGAIVSLAHGLNMRVVVECVETAEQLHAVRLAGCDEAQGYFLGKPMPASILFGSIQV